MQTSCKLRGTDVRAVLAQFRLNPNYNPTLHVPSRQTQISSGTDFASTLRSKGKDGVTSSHLISGEDQTLFNPLRESQSPAAILCHHCRVSFTWQAWGIPLSRDPQNPSVYYVVNRTCRPECSLALIRKRQQSLNGSTDHTFDNSEALLVEMCRKSGKHTIHVADDPFLLDVNGGPLTYEQYTKNQGSVICSNILMVPSSYVHTIFKGLQV